MSDLPNSECCAACGAPLGSAPYVMIPIGVLGNSQTCRYHLKCEPEELK